MASDNPPPTVDFGYRTVDRSQKREMVREVFDSVAGKYDVMNDLMSLGVHRLWKHDFIQALDPRPNRTLLDLAGGTGDITFGWLKKGGGPAILSDINAAMLSVGRDRATARALLADISFMVTDAEAIPLPDSSVDRVSMAFGLRNCTNKERVLAEARRVLKPGGKFFCLEFSRLQISAFEKLYDAWSFKALPRMGSMVAGDAASYQYLAESIRMFPDQETLKGMMETAGLEQVSYRNLSGGIAAIHQGWRL
jgi:demethylmenaquinone methyltransferase / 2-methoxy-6-polyprenyl-1,4-benzoquinol methylase